MNHTCPICTSRNVVIEGNLGQRIHLHCQDCGTWFSRKTAKRRTRDRRAERQAKERRLQGG